MVCTTFFFSLGGEQKALNTAKNLVLGSNVVYVTGQLQMFNSFSDAGRFTQCCVLGETKIIRANEYTQSTITN